MTCISEFWNMGIDCISANEEYNVKVSMGTHKIKTVVRRDSCAGNTLIGEHT